MTKSSFYLTPVYQGFTVIVPVIPQTLSILTSQLKQGLSIVDPGPLFLVADNIPSSAYDPVNIGWNGQYVRINDALYTFVQSALGYSNDAMTTFFNDCSELGISP
jgi:hypothetical protein